MSRMQRSKGASGERELARELHLLTGVKLVRNLEQSRQGGHDLVPDPEASGPVADALGRFAVEVKRHAKATPGLLREWWTQATEQARRAGLVPCLAYREDRQDWRVVLPLAALVPSLEPWDGHEWTADLSLLGFVTLIREQAAT